MALTIANEDRWISGDRVNVTATVTFDNSYPTGGEAIAASDFSGLSQIDYLSVNAHSDVATKDVVWDRTNSKLLIYIEDGTSGIEAEAGNTSDQSAVDVEVHVIGK